MSSRPIETRKDYTWSRGLGIEYYLVKTRSAQKKNMDTTTLPTVTCPSSSDCWALREIKALAREK
jgi:hypothetical protein